MKTSTSALTAAALAALLGTAAFVANAQEVGAVKVGANDIGGTVTGPHGPEAGVWVIAETTELPTVPASDTSDAQALLDAIDQILGG